MIVKVGVMCGKVSATGAIRGAVVIIVPTS